MSDFDILASRVQDTYDGKIEPSLPMGFDRLERYISIRKNLLFCLSGATGSGKTSLTIDAFILNPFDWLRTFGKYSKTKYKVIFFSMERSKEFQIAKWVSRRIFLDTGIILSLGSYFGWRGFPKLTKSDLELFLSYRPYMEELLSIVDILEGPRNPMGIKKYVDEYAHTVGTVVKDSEYKSHYEANDPNLITMIILDHLALVRPEKRDGITYSDPKSVIDLASADTQRFRDFYGFSAVAVSQFNREISNPIRLKSNAVTPSLDDIKQSGNIAENSDCVMALFDPYRYKVDDPCGYDLDALRSPEGAKKYRSLHILKNSYGADGIDVGLAFQPEIGHFKEMPKPNIIQQSDYQDIINDKYFRQ